MRPLTPTHLWSLPRVGPAVLSPDGRRAAFTVVRGDIAEDTMRSAIHVVQVDVPGAEPLQVTAGVTRDSQPVWSPEGKEIAFLSDREGGPPQLYLISLEGGEARRVTRLPVPVVSPRWIPGTRDILFLACVPPDAGSLAEVAEILEERRARPGRPRVTEEGIVRYWDRWLTDGDRHHFFRVSLETGEVRDWTPSSRRHMDLMDATGSFDVSADGVEAAFTADISEPPHRCPCFAVFTLDLTDPSKKAVRVSPCEEAHHRNPRYSPCGRFLVWGRQEEITFYAEPIELQLYDRSTGTLCPLAEGWECSPSEWLFCPDGAGLLCVAEERMQNRIFRIDLDAAEGGRPSPLTGDGWALAPSTAATGEMVYLASSLTCPPELWRSSWRSRGECRAERLTRLTRVVMEDVDLAEPEAIPFEGARGDRVWMYVLTPPGAAGTGTPLPLVQLVHGGPHGCAGNVWGWRCNPQVLAGTGRVVAQVNFHGSSSFGEDFLKSILGDNPTMPFEDVMAATDRLIDEGRVDPGCMAAAGGSFGGYMISWIAGHTDRFRALVNHAGVYNLHAQFGEDAPWGNRRAYGAVPWDGQAAVAHIDGQSPHTCSERFATPMLITHGERDFRVPVGQAFENYNVHVQKGVPARLIIYPGENHWITSPANSLQWYEEVLAWLDRWMGPGAR